MPQRSIALTGVVTPDRTLTVTVPDDVPPGPCRVSLLVGEPLPPDVPPADPDEMPFPYNLILMTDSPWPEGFTARREDLYADESDDAGG